MPWLRYGTGLLALLVTALTLHGEFPAARLKPPRPQPPMSALACTVPLQNFEIYGNTQISSEELRDTLLPYLGQPLDSDTLQRVSAAVAQRYINAGQPPPAIKPKQLCTADVMLNVFEQSRPTETTDDRSALALPNVIPSSAALPPHSWDQFAAPTPTAPAADTSNLTAAPANAPLTNFPHNSWDQFTAMAAQAVQQVNSVSQHVVARLTDHSLQHALNVINTHPAPTTLQTAGPGPDTRTDLAAGPNPLVASITRGQDDLLLLQLVVNKQERSAVLNAYQGEGHNIWIPLSQLMHELGLAVEVNAAAGTAHGWVLHEDNTFDLNLATGNLSLKGKEQKITPEMAVRQDDDIYVNSAVLQTWLPLSFRVEPQLLQLQITSNEPLPSEATATREQRAASLSPLQAAAMPPGTVTMPYFAASMPRIALEGSMDYQTTRAAPPPTVGQALPGQPNPPKLSGITSNGSAQFSGDLLYGTANVAVNVDQPQGHEVRLNGGSANYRLQSAQPDLLGPLKAGSVEAGDLNAFTLPLADTGGSGRGVRINNTPVGVVDDPDRFILAGSAPIGWEVEVYQNNNLLTYGRINASGRYSFNALPLRAGLNTFRLLFYGPSGEKQERTERYYLGDSMLAKGQVRYDIAAYQPGMGLLQNTRLPSATEPFLMESRIDVGLSPHTTLSAGLVGGTGATSNTVGQGGITNAVVGSLRQSFGANFVTLDALAGTAGGTGLGATWRALLPGDFNARASHQDWNGFSVAQHDQTQANDLDLERDFSLGTTGFTAGLGYTTAAYQSQGNQNGWNQHFSASLGRYNLTNTLTELTQNGVQQTTGNFGLTTHAQGVTFQGGVTYGLTAAQMLQQANLSAQYTTTRGLTLASEVDTQLSGDYTTRIATSARWLYGNFNVGLHSTLGTDGSADLGFSLGTVLQPVDDSKLLTRYELASPDAGNGMGRMKVRLFVDANGNGKYDFGEKLLPGVQIVNRQRGAFVTTDDQGEASLSSVAPYAASAISVVDESLPDIYLKPISSTIYVMAHNGRNGILDFPLQQLGEINGKLSAHTAQGTLKALAGMPVELLNAAGKRLDSTTTEYDGFYSFGSLAMGTWSIRVPAEALAKRGYAPLPPRQVALILTHHVMGDIELAANPPGQAPLPAIPDLATIAPAAGPVSQTTTLAPLPLPKPIITVIP